MGTASRGVIDVLLGRELRRVVGKSCAWREYDE
jgi:hypothetical protein